MHCLLTAFGCTPAQSHDTLTWRVHDDCYHVAQDEQAHHGLMYHSGISVYTLVRTACKSQPLLSCWHHANWG